MKYTETYLADLERVAMENPDIKALSGATVLITGAGGLICSALVDYLICMNRTLHLQMQVYAAARNREKIEKRFEEIYTDPSFHFLRYDALKEIEAEEHFDYIIHGAGLANPAAYVAQPVETMLGNFIGVKNVLEYARAHAAKRVLYISSSEVYGKKDGCEPYGEEEYGYVDILNPRACYPSAKRASETLCVAYQKEYGVDTVMVRPGHVYGPTMTAADQRASSQFPKDVLAGHDIVMKSPGAQMRSYCYVLDCASAILAVLVRGQGGQAYNISNPQSVVTIRQMAEFFAGEGRKQVVFECPTETEKAGYNLMDNSSLVSDRLEALGWKGLFDMRTGAAHTLEMLRAQPQRGRTLW